jgi:pimeloyl-ACP methyl ester carboxylesterase
MTADSYGAGSRAVILAHGARFDRTSWKAQALELAAAGFRVVAIDFRASVEARAGRETSCLYDEVCLAGDIQAAVRYLRDGGATTVDLVGASMGGGAVAQASVEAMPGRIDRIVLLAHMPITVPSRMTGRKLFIVARHDVRSGDVPRLPDIRAQFEQAPTPKELVILEGSEHAQFMFQGAEAKRLMREILRFLTAP